MNFADFRWLNGTLQFRTQQVQKNADGAVTGFDGWGEWTDVRSEWKDGAATGLISQLELRVTELENFKDLREEQEQQ